MKTSREYFENQLSLSQLIIIPLLCQKILPMPRYGASWGPGWALAGLKACGGLPGSPPLDKLSTIISQIHSKKSSNNLVTLSYVFFCYLKPWITAFNHLETWKIHIFDILVLTKKKLCYFLSFFLGHFPAYRLDQHNNLTRFFLTTDTVRCLYFKKATKNLWNRRNDWMVEFGL